MNTLTGLYEVSRTFTLHNTVDEDSGNFTCFATADIPGTGVRNDSVMFLLGVFGESVINSVITNAEKLVFNCTASGLPRPNITWTAMQDGIPKIISPTGTADFSTSTIIGTDDRQITSILTISRVKQTLADTYVCTASNFIRNDTADFYLTVHGKFRVLSQLILGLF